MHHLTGRLTLLVVAALALSGCAALSGSAVTVTATVDSPSSPSSAVAPSTGSGSASTGAVSASVSGSASGTPAGQASGSATGVGTGVVGSASPDAAPPSSAPASSIPPQPVRVGTFEGDGKTYGIGMAVVALFSVAPTDSTAFTQAATVTVNGAPADGAWFWQKPTLPGYALEALYREKDFWPAHSTIAVGLPVQGLSAGPGLAYADSLTLTFTIGAAQISRVDSATHSMTVSSDDTIVKTVPVSLGSASTPTYDGTKVVMEKDNPERMVSAPGEADPYDLLVPWSVRLTNSGEFIHAASWNTGNIGSRNTSHGCTNLDVADAQWFYNFSQIGDVVLYTDANPTGQAQPSWDGWGWWNLTWGQWSRGGVLLNH